ncbi:MAG: protein BatD [Candidatus Aminicenantes bacterium]|nr:protein BatD [Candidatus Aminicenantes bacterium]
MRRNPYRWAAVCFLGTFFCLTGPLFLFCQDLELKASVSATSVPTGRQFTLTVEISGSDIQSSGRPALPDLSAFADYLGSGSSQQFQIINGQMSGTLSLSHHYVARVEGRHTIPAISLDYKGKTYKTQPIDIEITKGSSPAPPPGRKAAPPPSGTGGTLTPESELEGNLFLKAEVDKTTVYPNQPITLVYKIYTRVEVTGTSIAESPRLLGFWSEELSVPQQPRTTEEIVDGKKFLVAEIKKSVLFPADTGEKVIDPLALDCEVRLRSERRSRDVFDRFFDDDFFNNSLFGRRVRTRISSRPIPIHVKPLPEAGRPESFGGIVGRYEMNVSLDKNQANVNDPVTMTVTFSGSGNIKMLPEPRILFPRELEVYDPKVSQNINRRVDAISGNKEFEYVFIPRNAGEYSIEPFTFSYFDPIQENYQTLTSPEFTIKAVNPSGTVSMIPGRSAPADVEFTGRDIRFIKKDLERLHRMGYRFHRSFWFIILLVLPAAAVGTAAVFRRKKDQMERDTAYARSRRASKVTRKGLNTAHKLMRPATQKEFYAEISRALLGYIADKLNMPAAGLMSEEAGQKLQERGVENDIVADVLEILGTCDFKRFAPASSRPEDLEDAYKKARRIIISLEKEKKL